MEKAKKSAADDCNASKLENSTADCKLVQLQASVTTVENRAAYWHTGWRSNLCKCDKCVVRMLLNEIILHPSCQNSQFFLLGKLEYDNLAYSPFIDHWMYCI